MRKRNKLILIISAVFVLTAGILFLVACKVAGWDLVGVFTGKTAIWIYILDGLYIMAIAFILLYDKFKV